MYIINLLYIYFQQPGHRVPRFSMINWALCVPDACSAAEVESALKDVVTTLVAGSGIEMNVRVEQGMCQVLQDEWVFDRNTWLAA